MEWPKLKRDRVGMTCRTLVELKNGSMVIPAGTICTVDGWSRGFRLLGEKCSHCGIRVYISRVPENDVEPIDSKEQ